MYYPRVLIVCGAFVCCTCFAVAQGEKDTWRGLRPLVGRWSGEGSGFGSVSKVTHEWKFVFGDKFLKLETKSVAMKEDEAGEVHEDVGLVSHDTDRSSFVFRQFVSEGYVNTFDVVVEPGDTGAVFFDYRESEGAGGVRARMSLKFLSETEYEMVLDLAMPGLEFVPCQRMVMRKVR